MQLFGSIIAAIAIVAVTIAIVTAQLGPFAEDDDGGGGGGDRQEQEQREDNSGSGSDDSDEDR
jgi:uncharacterized protein (DUF697 family)